ncbi:hypothetical protein PTE30175_03717 [Pandoraea terrae]|uniref:Aspartyl protease n=1 Tax=Pandoraea terrae TaxID=1537710 RepID=A0A5E4XCV7_9BURK|nr:hypothetical protein [Pandoraea terrae]VVE34249.1 hypothetical protein PTE30175_03717 [Pandoraea terrae]
MRLLKALTIAISVAFLKLPSQGYASDRSCANDWPNSSVRFDSEILYANQDRKTGPFVRVQINGKTVSMMLDTGSNINLLWDTSVLDESPGEHRQRVDFIASSTDARKVGAALSDSHGNLSHQQFYVLPNSTLSGDGYSGILSPQAVAGSHATIIDFEQNCFFISPAFEIRPDMRFHVFRGTTIPNPYGVMAIPLEIEGGKIPIIVDSAASESTILSTLVATRPKGPKSPRLMDVIGTEIPAGVRMRLVDLKINGQDFRSHPVIPKSAISTAGVTALGAVGMDILKDRIVYYHGALHQFTLLNRRATPPSTAVKLDDRIE